MGAIGETVVRSVGELVDRLTPQDRDASTGRFRDDGVYRGCRDGAWPLLTSLDRLGGIDPPHQKASLESHLLRNFGRYARPFLGHAATEWETLVVARHHGLPTRLLDWSYSPLVAAHFATLAALGPCVVWRLDWQRVHEAFGLPPVALLPEDLDRELESRGTSLQAMVRGEAPPELRFACMVEPPAVDARLMAQSGTLMLCSDTGRSVDSFLSENGLGDALHRYVVLPEDRDRFRDALDLCGIDERRLFPDLDGLAAQIRRYYS